MLSSTPVSRVFESGLLKRGGIALIALSLLATGCFGGSGADAETRSIDGLVYSGECAQSADKSVTVYSGRTENLMEPVFEAFECETGIGIEVRWADSTDLALLLDEEGDNTKADVYLSRSPGPVGFLESKGLLGAIDSDVLDLVEDQNRSDVGTWVGFTGRKRLAVYSLDGVAADELPDSVFELTEPQWQGRVALPATNGSFIDWFTVFRDQNGTDVATQWLDDMVANGARYYPNNRSIVDAANRGEIDLGLVNHYYNYQEAAANGDSHRAENHDLGDDDIGSLLIITAAAVDFDALGGGFEETTKIIEASGIARQ